MHRPSIMLSAVILLTLGFLVSVPESSSAGRIEPSLELHLAQSAPDELIPVLIRPVGTLAGKELKRQLAASYKTRKARHTAAVTSLKATADITQPAIRRALSGAQFSGRVKDVRGFWIDNVITASMTPTAIAEIASRADVDEVQYMPEVEFYKSLPTESSSAPTAAGTAEFDAVPGLRAIKADQVWAMGYTGKGRLVASLDTGVDGAHHFLRDKWRGNNGYSVAESWFYPLRNDQQPSFIPGDGDDHGTNVMGIMVAVQDSALRDDADLDTLGVAPDAQWISAAVIDVVGANILEAMQWCADPDGDPNTDNDVPDVVNNSWGSLNLISGCSDVFWNGIDNVEAAGAVMLFAAGNEGNLGTASVRNPGNRATTDLNAFSVGMVDGNTPSFPIHPLSSRGPSDCDNVSIKPEVVAPGVNIQTTRARGFTVQNVLGTSFAVPYVSGGVALMREYNPNATVDEIKQALISGAVDLGEPGPDNVYGHGMIDLAASLNFLPANTEPSIVVMRDHYTRPGPGGSTEMTLVLRSSGIPVDNVTVQVISEDFRLTVTDGSASFGGFTAVGDTADNSTDPFEFSVSEDAVEGERLAVRFEIAGSGGYTKMIKGAIQVGPTQTNELYTHTAGNFILTVSSLAQYGLHPLGLAYRFPGFGYAYGGDGTQSMFEGAFLVGVGPDQVSDAARDAGSFPDNDFQVDPGGRLQVIESGAKFAEETRAAFSDAIAENPIGLFIVQRTFVVDEPDHDDYLTFEYTIYNRSGATVNNLHAGMYFDWDFPWLSGANDGGGYDANDGVGWMREDSGNRFRGIAVLTPPGATSYRHFRNDPEIYSPAGDTLGWDGFTDAEKWGAMTEGFVQTDPPTVPEDASHLMATGPFSIADNDSVRVAFALIGATSESDLIAFAGNARQNYAQNGIVSAFPTSIMFMDAVGQPSPSDTLVLYNGTNANVTFEVDAQPNWLAVDPSNGTMEALGAAELALQTSNAGLGEGTYEDILRLTTNDSGTPTIEIAVTLTIEAGLATLQPAALSFRDSVGGDSPDSKDLTIGNDTDADLQYTVGDLPSWLSAVPGSGTVLSEGSGTITVTANTDGFSAGTFRDTIHVSTDNVQLGDVDVPVTLTMDSGESMASIDPNPFNPEDGPVVLRAAIEAGTPLSGKATIYDIAGFKVRELSGDEIALGAGLVQVFWDGRNDDKVVANGVYFGHVQVEVGDGPAFDKTYTIVLKK